MAEPQSHSTDALNGFTPAVNGVQPAEFLPSQQLPLRELAQLVNAQVQRFLEQEPKNSQVQRVQEQTRISLKVIQEAFEKYDLSAISLSYNGGKDCLVLLILYIAALASHPALQNPDNESPSIQSVYIVSKHPFPEVESFVESTSKTYSLTLARYANSMKLAFQEYLHDFPQVKAIFVGTRRTDPHGANLSHFDETDHGWPRFMRVHPVVDWQYVDIWTFIRQLGVPYCTLYDQGYTSLGGTTDTHRNPALRRSSISSAGEAAFIFRPAYELVEDGEERLGRDREWKPVASGTSVMHRVEGSKHESVDNS